MARKGDRNGFSIDNIVDYTTTNNTTFKTTNKNTTKVAKTRANKATAQATELLKQDEDKDRVYLYLDTDVAEKLRDYGKRIGRRKGGASMLANIALREFFERFEKIHGLN